MADRTLTDEAPEVTWAEVLPNGTAPAIELVLEMAGLGVECTVRLTPTDHPDLGTLSVGWRPYDPDDDDA